MKIIIVNQAHPTFGGPGGAERSVKCLAEAIARRGHDVTSLAMAQKHDTGHLAANGVHSEHMISGVRTVLFGKVERTPNEVEMMLEVIERERPDLVHTNTFWHNDVLWRALADRGIPIVHTLREYKLACPDNMYRDGANCAGICETCIFRARTNRLRSEAVRSVIGISHFVLDRHLALGVFPGATHRAVIPNAIPNSVNGFRHLASGTDGSLTLGYLGRLHPVKGVDILIDAVLGRPDEDVRLVVAGPIQDAAIDRRIAIAEGDSRFDYIGFVDPSDLFSRVDALVVPSRWPEPFGRIVVEAFAHGVPVLAARSGALPELVTPGKTGWLFDDADGGLDIAIRDLVAERARIPALRAACLKAAERYRPEAIAAEHEALYGRTLRALPRPNGRRRSPAARNRSSKPSRLLGGIVRSRRSRPSVLVITGEFPKLSETFVVNHITGLIDQGADVTVFAERKGAPDQWHENVDKYRLMERTLWYGMPPALEAARDHLTQGSRALQRELNKLLKDCSIMAMPPPLDALARRVVDEQARTEVKLRLFHAAEVLIAASRSFNIVHCHFGHRGLFAAELKRMQALSGRVVVQFHGIDMTEHVRRKGLGLYDNLKSECALYLPISNVFRERLLHLGIPPRDVVVHHVGIDCSMFRFAPRLGAANEPLRLLTVGRLVAKKGVEYGVRAVAGLGKNGNAVDCRYDIVGDGPERPALEKLVAQLNLCDRVTFHGALPHGQVMRWMEKSHVLLAPSVTPPDGDMEGIPTTVMEAMASGMPVVASRHSGIPELVKDQETGFLVDERDFEGIAAAVRTLAANRELWPELGRAGRQLVEREFNQTVQSVRLMSLYEELGASPAETVPATLAALAPV